MAIVVPFGRSPAAQAQVQRPMPDPQFAMMAAALMHENGRLVQQAASKTWEYDSNANSSWSGPSNQPDGKVVDYDGNKSGFEASQDIAEQMRSGKLKPGDIVRVPADKSSSGQEIYLQHHGADFGDWPFLPVRKSKQTDLTS